MINRIPGALNISDNLLIHGRTQEDHDRALAAVFKRLSDKHLTLNKTKCAFNKSSLKFFGHIFSASGMSPDPEKVQAICEAPAPESTGELRILLGMVSYFSRYIKDFATITDPLHSLTKKNATWQWSTNQQQALKTLKRKLTNAPVMLYFDPTKQTELIVDTSPVGLGAVLTQKTANSNGPMHVIAYASRSLTDVERRYSQTEREALAIMWGCEYHHLHLYSAPFTLMTDHKPLEPIFGNPSSKPPARIERWALRLQPYNFSIIYHSGKNNPADYMSRHPLPHTSSHQMRSAETYINFITSHATP